MGGVGGPWGAGTCGRKPCTNPALLVKPRQTPRNPTGFLGVFHFWPLEGSRREVTLGSGRAAEEGPVVQVWCIRNLNPGNTPHQGP